MINFLLVMGTIWLLLFMGQPLIAYMDALHVCDLKYATDRRRRVEVYEELNALHQESEVFCQMKKEKIEKKHPNRKPSPNNSKARRVRKRKPLQEAYAEKQRRLAENAGSEDTEDYIDVG